MLTRRRQSVNKTFRSANRLAQLLIAAVLAAGVTSVAVVNSDSPAEAAACQGCIMVSAPSISLNVTAQPGQQAVIDQQGGVAVYTPLTTGVVGGPGTVWLVGHRTTHGSVFNQVPMLAAGDPIDLIDDAGTHRYIVNRLLVVSESDWQSQIDIHDTSRSLLILQTSHPDHQLRYLIEAFGIGLAPTAPPVVAPTAAPPAVAPTTAPPVVAPTAAPPVVVLAPAAAPIPTPAPALGGITKFGWIKATVQPK